MFCILQRSHPLPWWQLCTLGILSTSFMRNASTVLKEFPHMLSTCWLLFFHSAVQLISNHHNRVEVGWLWRPGDLMQHSITLLRQIALTQPGGVLGHCPVELLTITPLPPCFMVWTTRTEIIRSPTLRLTKLEAKISNLDSFPPV